MGPEAEMVAHCVEGRQGPDEDGEGEAEGAWQMDNGRHQGYQQPFRKTDAEGHTAAGSSSGWAGQQAPSRILMIPPDRAKLLGPEKA